jgi:hypothetical protein
VAKAYSRGRKRKPRLREEQFNVSRSYWKNLRVYTQKIMKEYLRTLREYLEFILWLKNYWLHFIYFLAIF